MTTKQIIIEKTILEVKRKLTEIKSILDATPIQDICDCRTKVVEILDNETIEALEKSALIKKIAIKEKKAFAVAEKQKDLISLCKEEAKLSFELDDLKNELYLTTK